MKSAGGHPAKLTIRSYVWLADVPFRLPRKAYADPPARFPALAGARLRYLSIERLESAAEGVFSWTSGFAPFDEAGTLVFSEMVKEGVMRMDHMRALDAAEKTGKVAVYAVRKAIAAYDADKSWIPTPAELGLVKADLLPSGHEGRKALTIAKTG